MLPRRDFLGGLLALLLSPALGAQPGLAAFRQRWAASLEVPEAWLDPVLSEQLWRSGADEASIYRAFYPQLTWNVLEWSVRPTDCPHERPRWEDPPGA